MFNVGESTIRMKRLTTPLPERSEAGATASEYALLMGFIALVIVIGIGAFGLSVNGWYEGLAIGVEAVLP
jgi:Flp pilus assembly pilin Flp